jgi:hypothetical protein
MSVFDQFIMTFFSVYGLFLSFIIFEKDRSGNENFRKAHLTVWNDHETVENAQERSGTVNGQEHLGTIGSERNNASERIVENGLGTVTLTQQKRKNHCNFPQILIIHL